LLVLCGTFLPTYGPSDYESPFIRNGGLVLVFAVLIIPALLALGISIGLWFRKVSLWIITPGIVLLFLAEAIHVFMGILAPQLACFLEDGPCTIPPIQYGTGFWLPIVGFLLSIIGIIAARVAAKQQMLRAAQAA